MVKKINSSQFGKQVFFAALRSIRRRNIDGLKTFHSEGERLFTSDFNRLQVEADSLPDDDGRQIEHLIDQRYEMEALRELTRNFSIVGLFTVFEMFLRRMLRHLRWAGAAVPGCIQTMRFDDMKKAFRDIDLPITESTPDWQAIIRLRIVRNCIAHSRGRIDNKKTVRKLRKDDEILLIEATWRPAAGGGESEPSSWRLQLTEKYFGENAALVEHVCEQISTDCFKYYPKGKA